MFGYQDVQISLAFSGFYLLIALILIGSYSFYVYRYTIPQIPTLKKILLITLRVFALLILCLIIFEPILNLSKNLILEPANIVFLDNSRSIQIEDGTERINNVNKVLNDLSSISTEGNLEFYSFGNSIRLWSFDSLSQLKFSDGATNLQDVFDHIKNSDENISSVTLITDGVITSGSNPYYDAINAGIPVFTIGIGDTTQRTDVELKKVLHNDIVYAETPTSIVATISNKGFAGESVTAALYEENRFVSQQVITLSNSGIQNLSFEYRPQSSGEKKLSIHLSSLDGEFTSANNKRVFYVNVLSNKIKVLLLASNPNSDFTFIKNSLKRDENIQINSIVQISQNKFQENLNYNVVDSADVLFLIGFPADATLDALLNRVLIKIREKKTPFFFTFSSGVSTKLPRIGSELPFTIAQMYHGYKEVQPYFTAEQLANPIFRQGNSSRSDNWNNLPPVLQPNSIFSPRVESKTLAQIKVNNNVVNSPLIVSNSFSGRRSIAVLAKDIWRWKLQVAPKGLDLFDSFIVSSLRWLRAGEDQKLVNVKTSKKNFSQGERIEFTAEVFDESFNPVSDAGIKIKIFSEKNNYETDMQNVGSGLYEGSIIINEPGDFNFSAEAIAENRLLGKDNGSFNVGEIDIEMVNPVMNYSFLNLVANETGGEFFFTDDYSLLLNKLKELKINSSKEKIVTSEIALWSDTWMLIIAVLLFSLEWFIRKRNGML